MLRIARVARNDIQEASLDAVKGVPAGVSTPVLKYLSAGARDPLLRKSALEELCAQKGAGATETLLLAAHDENLAPKAPSLGCLKQRERSVVGEVLLASIDRKLDKQATNTGVGIAVRDSVTADNVHTLVAPAREMTPLFGPCFSTCGIFITGIDSASGYLWEAR